MPAPVIETARLRLRPHRRADMDAFWVFYGSERARHMDRPNNKTHLWYGLSSEVGSWDLLGFGCWAIETKDGQMVGQTGFTHPPHFAEIELGWLVFDGFEGQGLAHEACVAARDHGMTQLGLDGFVSYIHRDNARSIALAERLGATLDADADAYDADDAVYRHRRAA